MDSQTLKPEWRDVGGYGGRYQVSSLGGVRSKAVQGRSMDGAGWRDVSTSVKKGGYLRVLLRRTGQKQRGHAVHRLVLAAFAGECPDGMEARHLNGDPADNRLSNLEWATRQVNSADKKRHGTWQGGTNNGLAKLEEAAVADIKQRLRGGESLASLGREYGVRWQTIQAIRDGKTWIHV